jgi:hypothetical protein
VRVNGAVNVNIRLVAIGAASPYFYRGRLGRYATRLWSSARRHLPYFGDRASDSARAVISCSSEPGEGSVQVLGVILALLAGGFWASYIVLGARIGRIYPA